MKISIIIPVYNKVKYLTNIFNQIIKQSFRDFECIVIDDGSSDGSENICDIFAERDSRFRVFHISNSGVSRARNVGIEESVGEYITFIDSDDEILPDYLENLICCVEKSGADIVISGHQKFWEDNESRTKICPPVLSGTIELADILPNFASIQKNTGIFGWCWAKMFHRTLVGEARFDEKLRLAEDFDFYLKLYKKVQRLHFDNKCLYRYRQEADNSSMIVADDKIDYYAQLELNLRYREFLKCCNSYEGDNVRILEQMLSNYLYFCIYHCPEALVYNRVCELASIQEKEKIYFKCGNKLQRYTLKCMSKKKYWLASRGIIVYKKIRNLCKIFLNRSHDKS